ncbi:MAG: flagellar hook-length control protein FliK [Proteobacteria bacterium]|nr:flagellar hook-length control protein FliK [Pseudomonadota bacterium]
MSKHLVDKVKELQTMMNQKNIKNGISEFRVNLQPHSLGPIDIKIEIKDQSVYAVFLTNHKEDLHTLYDMKNAIQTIFKENNLEAKDQNLNFFMNQQNHHPRKYNNYHQPSEVLNDKLPEWLWTYQPSVIA